MKSSTCIIDYIKQVLLMVWRVLGFVAFSYLRSENKNGVVVLLCSVTNASLPEVNQEWTEPPSDSRLSVVTETVATLCLVVSRLDLWKLSVSPLSFEKTRLMWWAFTSMTRFRNAQRSGKCGYAEDEHVHLLRHSRPQGMRYSLE